MKRMESKIIKLTNLIDTLSSDENDDDTNEFLYKDRYASHDWEELEESLKGGYKPREYPIDSITVVKIWFTDKYLVYDGSHRVKLLKEIYGSEYQIEVKVISKLRVIGEILVLFFALPLMYIKKIINGI